MADNICTLGTVKYFLLTLIIDKFGCRYHRDKIQPGLESGDSNLLNDTKERGLSQIALHMSNSLLCGMTFHACLTYSLDCFYGVM